MQKLVIGDVEFWVYRIQSWVCRSEFDVNADQGKLNWDEFWVCRYAVEMWIEHNPKWGLGELSSKHYATSHKQDLAELWVYRIHYWVC